MNGTTAQESDLENLVKQIQTVFASDGYQKFASVVQQNKVLRERIERLRITQDENTKHYKDVYNQVEELEATIKGYHGQMSSLVDENKALKTSLSSAEVQSNTFKVEVEEKLSLAASTMQKKNEGIERLEAENRNASKEVQKYKEMVQQSVKKHERLEIDKKTAERNATESAERAAKLDKSLHSLRLMGKTLEPMRNEILAEGIMNAFTALRMITHTYFGNLDEVILRDPACWKEITEHGEVLNSIPLAATNSSIAKLMRQAAILAICSEALMYHIFRPTFTLEETHEIALVLDDMAVRECSKSTFVRSVLLNLNTKNQSKNRTTAIREAVESVVETVQGLIASPKGTLTFKEELVSCFEQICEHWVKVQNADAVVCYSIDSKNEDHWQLLTEEVDKNNTHNRPLNSNFAKKGEKQGVSGGNKNSDKSRAETKTAYHGIWPTFMITRVDKAPELLQRGFALEDAKLREGRDEMYKYPPPSVETKRRNQRANRRKTSNPDSSGLKSPFLSQD